MKMRLLPLLMITAALLDAQAPSIAGEAVAILKANCEGCREADKPTAALIREHTRLTFTFEGRPFRLTDVSGRLIDTILA